VKIVAVFAGKMNVASIITFIIIIFVIQQRQQVQHQTQVTVLKDKTSHMYDFETIVYTHRHACIHALASVSTDVVTCLVLCFALLNQ